MIIECTDKEGLVLNAKLTWLRMTAGERAAAAAAKAASIRAWQESHWTQAQIAERDRRDALEPNERLVEDLLKRKAECEAKLADPKLAAIAKEK